MRKFFLTIIVLLLLQISFGQSIIKVTLLGTGTPQPLMERFGPSILVQAGSKTLLFDAGRGCLQRLRTAVGA